MKIDYLEVLNLFTSKNDRYDRDWMGTPFKQGDFCYSTNASILCQLPAVNVVYVDENKDAPFCEKIILPSIQNNVIDIAEINALIDKCPKTASLIDNTIDCEACYTFGTVDYTFSHNGREYKSALECPVCEGYGYTGTKTPDPSGAMVPDYDNATIKINEMHFAVPKIQKILEAAKLLQSDTITIVNDSNPVQFKINDVYIVLMPLILDETVKNVATASFHFLGSIEYTPLLINQ